MLNPYFFNGLRLMFISVVGGVNLVFLAVTLLVLIEKMSIQRETVACFEW